MILVASILGPFATAVGLVAGAIAIGGFLAHVRPVFARASEEALREATVIGGLLGMGAGLGVVVLSALIR